jgi:transcription elongation GreA/GreB family factor
MLAELLYAHCQKYIEGKRLIFEEQKKSLQVALTSESKSSAGDKHETGRAMIQLEREKLGNQIAEVEQNQQKLKAIKNYKSSNAVSMGSIVLTDKANYYLAIAADICEIDSRKYYCISAQSPIGLRLLGKRVNDQVEFNNLTSTILKII